MTEDVKFKPSDRTIASIILGITVFVALGAVWGVYLLLPLLIELASNLLIFGLEVGALLLLGLGLLQLLMAKESIYYKMKLFARNMRKRTAGEDPVGTIEVSIGIFHRRLEEIRDHKTSAEGALTRLKNKIRNREKTGLLDIADKEEALTTAAERTSRPAAEIERHAVASQRARKAADSLQPMVDDQEFINQQLSKAEEVATNALADLESQKQVLSVQFEAYKESRAQAKAFKKFFGKNPELEMIDFAVEAIERQTTDTQAEIEQLMSQLTPRIQAAQLQREADAAEAMRQRAAKQISEHHNMPTQQLTDNTATKVNRS